MQGVSGGMWLQFAMGHDFESRLLEKSMFHQSSDDVVQASWQVFFFRNKQVAGILGCVLARICGYIDPEVEY